MTKVDISELVPHCSQNLWAGKKDNWKRNLSERETSQKKYLIRKYVQAKNLFYKLTRLTILHVYVFLI